MTTMHPVIAKLRELRRAAGLSLQQVERSHGIKAVVIGSYERGDRRPTIDSLQQVLDIYGYQLVAVPRDRSLGGRPTIRTPEQITDLLRAIADQFDPQLRGDGR